MNEVLKTIIRRRSVRLFKNDPLRLDDVEEIIEAGRYAPSANNSQDWFFTLVQSRAMITRINGWIVAEIDASGNAKLQEMLRRDGGSIFRDAPTLIIISTETKSQLASVNAAAAAENMLIAAESMGIASCWIGLVSLLSGSRLLDSYADELHIPKGYCPQFGITLGYGTGLSPPAPERKRNIVSYIL
jgi:nitroreductase